MLRGTGSLAFFAARDDTTAATSAHAADSPTDIQVSATTGDARPREPGVKLEIVDGVNHVLKIVTDHSKRRRMAIRRCRSRTAPEKRHI